MAVPSTSGSTGSRPRTSRALQVTLRLLAMLVFAQAGMGQTSRLAVHVPLGVAILGLVGALLARTPATWPEASPACRHPATTPPMRATIDAIATRLGDERRSAGPS
jgi:heme A synthase